MYSTRNTLNMVLHLAHPGLKIVYGNPSQDIDLHINISIRRSIMLGGTKMLNSVECGVLCCNDNVTPPVCHCLDNVQGCKMCNFIFCQCLYKWL